MPMDPQAQVILDLVNAIGIRRHLGDGADRRAGD